MSTRYSTTFANYFVLAHYSDVIQIISSSHTTPTPLEKICHERICFFQRTSSQEHSAGRTRFFLRGKSLPAILFFLPLKGPFHRGDDEANALACSRYIPKNPNKTCIPIFPLWYVWSLDSSDCSCTNSTCAFFLVYGDQHQIPQEHVVSTLSAINGVSLLARPINGSLRGPPTSTGQ